MSYVTAVPPVKVIYGKHLFLHCN